ncbi:hypothetical protein pb186bvf_009260 [Paramecium bursaria]
MKELKKRQEITRQQNFKLAASDDISFIQLIIIIILIQISFYIIQQDKCSVNFIILRQTLDLDQATITLTYSDDYLMNSSKNLNCYINKSYFILILYVFIKFSQNTFCINLSKYPYSQLKDKMKDNLK